MSVKDKWGRTDIHFHYDNLIEYTEVLTPEQLGVFIKRIVEFTIDGIVYDRSDFNDSGEYLAYKQTCNFQINQGEKYERISEVRKVAGKKGGEANAKQIKANASDKGKDNGNGNDKEKDNGDSFSWFDSLWNEYPSKRGRDRITQGDLEKLEQVGEEKLRECIRNYKIDLADNPGRAVMHGSTFFLGRYKDYLPEVFEPVEKAPTVEETEKTKHREADQAELTDLEEKLEKVKAELERTDSKSDRDKYNALRDKEALYSGQIEAYKKRSQS